MPTQPRAPLIALLTDFGLIDPYVGVMKGVMLGIVPGMALVDLTHTIPPQDIETGAWQLHIAWRYQPAGSVILCVVDPGVGSARRPVAFRLGGRIFVGPDNGLFTYALAAAPVEEAIVLDNPRFHLPQVSNTFHGRDLFSPSAAHLAAGVPLSELGSPLDPATLIRLDIPAPAWEGETLVGRIAHVDYYGNLITNIEGDLAARALSTEGVALTLEVSAEHVWRITSRGSHFAAGNEGELFMLRDSSGRLTIALRNSSAAAQTGAKRGTRITLTGLHGAATP